MQLKTEEKIIRRCRPFLVLPTIKIDSFDKGQRDFFKMTNKNTGLKLFTKTWTPKQDSKSQKAQEPPRPLTATLEKPMILDISLMGKIDMSKIRKEFLNISNLCRVPLIIKNKNTVKVNRPLSLPPPERHKNKKKKVSDTEDEESTSVRSARKTNNDKINSKIKTASNQGATVKSGPISDANNNKTFKVTRKCGVASGKVMNIKSELIKSTKLPEPCSTCGRPDQPERFHSHPATPMRASGKKVEATPAKIPVKSTVQKPIAIKYKSKANAEKKPTSPTKKPTSVLATQRTHHPTVPPKVAEAVPSRASSAKRTLTCYLCGREFGTASLPLHEPKCLVKWERENANLPTHLQRKPPPKPDHSMSKEEWNKVAWEASQSTLTPCQNCGRTFYPDRLLVHQRSCKTPQNNTRTSSSELHIANNPVPMSQSTPATPSGKRPPSIECYICGKLFGSNSIKIHEKQCLKKWNIENESLPKDMRSPPPTRNSEKKLSTPEPEQQRRSSTENEKEKENRPTSARKPPLFPCYICGKLFTVNSIYIHEPQCLKMWKIENDKLPANKRRPQPLKPDIKFTREMNVGYFFVRYKFGWNSVDYSMFSTFQFVAHTIGTLFSLSFFTKFLKMDDAVLGMISSGSKIIGCLFYAFAPTPLWYYVGAAAEMLNGTSFIAMRAIVSKLVPPEELGQINSLFGVAEAIIPVVYGPLYSRIYAKTIDVFPGAFFIAGAVLTAPAIFIFIWLYFEHKRDRRNEKLEKAQEEGLLKKDGLHKNEAE